MDPYRRGRFFGGGGVRFAQVEGVGVSPLPAGRDR